MIGILGLFGGILKNYGATLLKWGAIALGVLAVVFQIKKSGRVEERARQLEENQKSWERMNEASRDSPRSRDDLLRKLREHGF